MFGRSRSWVGGGHGKSSRNIHSLDHLKYLYHVLTKNTTVTEQNRNLLVETIRSITEILIWGDQNDSSVFDFFLEKNMFVFFLNILRQKSGRYVCVQLLQTLNILFENISHETSLCKDGPGPGLGTAGCRCAPCAVVFLLLCECLCPPCVLACLGCQRACSRLGSLDGRCIFSQCLRLAVHDHGSAGAGFWGGLSSWFAQGLTLFMSYLFSPLCTWREDSDVSSFSCKDTSLLGSEPHPLTSCDL